jgi:hypothetical protein
MKMPKRNTALRGMFLQALQPKSLPLPLIAQWRVTEKPSDDLQQFSMQLVQEARSNSVEKFKMAMEDLVYFYLMGECKLGQCLAFLKLLDLRSSPAAAECFVDVLWLIGTQASAACE